MWGKRRSRSGFAWLELLLELAILMLLFQAFSSLRLALVWALDVRNWSRAVFVSLNVGVVLVLVGMRFGPELASAWRARRRRLVAECQKQAKQHELIEQRKLFERMREARKRQVT